MTPEGLVSADLQAWLGALPGVLVERRNVGTAQAATGAVGWTEARCAHALRQMGGR